MQTQGAAACGMCIEVLAVDNMPALNDQLTKWDYKKNITVPFIAMIFDQCTDPICEWNGYLDFVSAIRWSSALYVPQWHAHHQPLLSGVSIRPHERLTLEFMLFVSNECANRTCTARSSRWPRVRPAFLTMCPCISISSFGLKQRSHWISWNGIDRHQH